MILRSDPGSTYTILVRIPIMATLTLMVMYPNKRAQNWMISIAWISYVQDINCFAANWILIANSPFYGMIKLTKLDIIWFSKTIWFSESPMWFYILVNSVSSSKIGIPKYHNDWTAQIPIWIICWINDDSYCNHNWWHLAHLRTEYCNSYLPTEKR